MLHHAAISVIYTLFKEGHSSNAFIIEFTLAGIEMEVNALQQEKALFPIEVTPSGITIDFNAAQSSNA